MVTGIRAKRGGADSLEQFEELLVAQAEFSNVHTKGADPERVATMRFVESC